ncbi:MAG: UMP kinase [Candidatus Micrarchaeia archaeon]
MQTLCISLGGSVISNKEGFNVAYLHKMSILLNKYNDKKFIIVTGGGYTNRKYIELLRKSGASEFVLDEVGIIFTKLNAIAAKVFFNDAYPNIVSSLDELKKIYVNNRVIFVSGLMPGITTDAVAVLACEAVGCSKIINVSEISGVYDRNPNQKGAKKLIKITHDKLIELAGKLDTREAKVPFIFDLVACKLAKRSNIRVDFIGSNLEELELAILGKKHNGSIAEG